MAGKPAPKPAAKKPAGKPATKPNPFAKKESGTADKKSDKMPMKKKGGC